MKRLSWAIVAAIGLASPAFAHATAAYVTTDVDMFSGPDQDYPQVDRLEEGSEVDVQGCTQGWEWCDVIAYGERGWVPGGYLEMEDRSYGWVSMPEYAPRYGIPIVTFSIQNYWDRYYYHRPFYYNRWTWYRWHRPYRHYPYPVDFPRPHPIHRPPVHHPIDYPPPYHHGQHPVDYPPPYHHGEPHPVDYPPPYHHGQPHPVDYPPPYHHGNPAPQPPTNPPPRVVPMPHPVPTPPPASSPKQPPHSPSKDRDPAEQGQRR